MAFRIILILSAFAHFAFGGINVGMSQSEISNIINQAEDIVSRNPSNPTNEITQEFWNADTGSWVETLINPVINGGGLVVNPATGNIDHTANVTTTTPSTSVPEVPPTSDNNDNSSGGGGGSTSNVDTDDDVPTLLSIRSKIHTLQQEMVKQVEEVRGAERSVITNWDTNETTSKRVDYGDLYAVLEKMVPDNTEAKKTISEKNEEELDSDVEQAKQDFDETEDELEDALTSYTNIEMPNKPATGDEFTRFEMDVVDIHFI